MMAPQPCQTEAFVTAVTFLDIAPQRVIAHGHATHESCVHHAAPWRAQWPRYVTLFRCILGHISDALETLSNGAMAARSV